MTDLVDVLESVATLLSTAGVGKYLTDPNATYALTDTGIRFGTMPDGSSIPDRFIVLNAFTLLADPINPEDRILLQVSARGARNNYLDAQNVSRSVFNVIHGIKNTFMGSAGVSQILFSTSAPMGEDALTRTIFADKYFIDVDVDATVNRPGW